MTQALPALRGPARPHADEQDGRRTRLIWAVAALLGTLDLSLHAALIGWPRVPDDRQLLLGLGLAAAFGLAEVLVVHLRLGREAHTLSVSELPLVAGLLVLDPTVLVAARLGGAVLALVLHRRQPALKVAVNAGALWLEVLVALAVWQALVGDAGVLDPRGWLAVLGSAVASNLVVASVIAGVIALAQGHTSGSRGTLRMLLGVLTLAAANGSFALTAVLIATVDPRAVATLLAVAIGLGLAYRAYVSLQQRHSSLEQLADFSRAIGGELHLEAVALAVLVQVRALLQAGTAELVLHADGEVLRLVSTTGQPVRVERDELSALARHLVPEGWNGQPLLARRGARQAALRDGLRTAGLRDAVVVPLADEHGRLGTLLAGDRLGDVGTFDAHDRSFLTVLANHASIGLRNGQLADRLREQALDKERQALHDGLTGLPNRTRFAARAAVVLAESVTAAVLLMDLDRFKEINDTLGHHIGDLLLVVFAERLQRAVPEGAAVARLGGDEFVVCLPDVDARGALRVAQILRQAVAAPVVLQELTIELDVSIGVALAPEHGRDAAALLQHADVAMYAAKAARSGIELYRPDADQHSPRRLALIGELRGAIAADDLVVHYQPKVDVVSGAVLGAEALVRWRHPVHGLLAPDEFVGLAEQSGLIRPLTLSVLSQALHACAQWQTGGRALGVAVNLSARSLLDGALVEDVAECLAGAGLGPGTLTLEITETSAMADPVRTIAILRRLVAIGVAISIDDFGTGYSSLAYLQRLPVDEIKVDRSFVHRLATRPDDEAIVASVIDLAHRLGKRVVAEGVEDAATHVRLAQLGCDVAQGYWISPPLDEAAMDLWLACRPATPPALRLVRPLPALGEVSVAGTVR